MKTNTDYNLIQNFALLLEGPPKTGKTTMAMLFPQPYFVDLDDNLGSAIRRHPEKKFFYENPNFDKDGKTLPDWAVWQRANTCVDEALASPDVKTLVVDSLSRLSDALIAHLLKLQNRTQMQIQDYGTFKNEMAKFLLKLRSTTKYVVVIAHEKYDKDEMTGVMYHRINIVGQLADYISAYFTDVWRTEVEEKAGKFLYSVRTMPSARCQALGNSLGLPAKFEFSWDELVKYLGGNK